MNQSEWLIARATQYWDLGQQLPLDLFSELLSAGLDVEALEAIHLKEPV